MKRHTTPPTPRTDCIVMLNDILERNPQIVAAWFDDPDNPNALTILTHDNPTARRLDIPADCRRFTIHRRSSPGINILRAPATHAQATNANQACQNEPIQLGTQIQPSGASWVGTAGAPVSWITGDGNRHWGILSNYHVMAMGIERVGHAQHQPDDRRPACATLTAWTNVGPDHNNLVDAAIADALIDGRHTIAPTILDIGELTPGHIDARVNLPVVKAGRTTGTTTGKCIATGAAISVGYGEFTARFIDQDVFEGDSASFSAAGDSGSLIVSIEKRQPVALLFAGSTDITIGNPFRYVRDALGLQKSFN